MRSSNIINKKGIKLFRSLFYFGEVRISTVLNQNTLFNPDAVPDFPQIKFYTDY